MTIDELREGATYRLLDLGLMEVFRDNQGRVSLFPQASAVTSYFEVTDSGALVELHTSSFIWGEGGEPIDWIYHDPPIPTPTDFTIGDLVRVTEAML
jgi:hypothetical protein